MLGLHFPFVTPMVWSPGPPPPGGTLDPRVRWGFKRSLTPPMRSESGGRLAPPAAPVPAPLPRRGRYAPEDLTLAMCHGGGVLGGGRGRGAFRTTPTDRMGMLRSCDPTNPAAVGECPHFIISFF